MIKIEFESPRLQKEVEDFLVEEKDEQEEGRSRNMGIIRKEGRIFYSNLPAFSFIWKVTRYFDQDVTATCQCGDLAIVNKKGKTNNPDTKTSLNCGFHQVWFNAVIQERENIKDSKKQDNFNELLDQ